MKLKKEQYGWLKELKESGYTYIMMPKRNKREFWATKANQKKDGTFRDNSNFDSIRLEEGEEWIPGEDTKNVFIRL